MLLVHHTPFTFCSSYTREKGAKAPPIHTKLNVMQRMLRSSVVTDDGLYNIGAFIPYVKQLYPTADEKQDATRRSTRQVSRCVEHVHCCSVDQAERSRR